MSAVWPAQLTAQANVCMPAPAVLVIALWLHRAQSGLPGYAQ